MPRSRSDIESEQGRLEGESTEIQKHLETRADDLDNVSDVLDNFNADGGTEEGVCEIIDHVTHGQALGSDKFDETNSELDEKTSEVIENKEELQETAGEVDSNYSVPVLQPSFMELGSFVGDSGIIKQDIKPAELLVNLAEQRLYFILF